MRIVRWLSSLLALVACSSPRKHEHGGHAAHGGMAHRFDGAERWAAVFDDPARDAWQEPDRVIASLALDATMTVADVGAGTGYFAVRLARAVPDGKVYGIDIEPDMVRYMTERAEREGLANLVAVLGAPEDARVPEPVDVILIVDTYHHIADRVPYFTRLAGSLRPGGRLAIVDFTPESPMGPPAEMRIPVDRVLAELAEAGYREVARHDFLPNQFFVEVARR
ncbi:MAG: class I SAM-dependent methyltransferase [Deltaproteobacteria bacterium]|nr:class I SAM-dependent methyltransferase [Kofleriaceae bacterium]